MAETDTGISGALTDGTGIGTWTTSKVLKDFVADALLGAAAAVVAAGVAGVPTDTAQLTVAAVAVANGVIHAAYRAILKWAQS